MNPERITTTGDDGTRYLDFAAEIGAPMVMACSNVPTPIPTYSQALSSTRCSAPA
mgnify:CR=1 FL=1